MRRNRNLTLVAAAAAALGLAGAALPVPEPRLRPEPPRIESPRQREETERQKRRRRRREEVAGLHQAAQKRRYFAFLYGRSDEKEKRLRAAINKMTNHQRHQWSRFCGQDRSKRKDPEIAERFAKTLGDIIRERQAAGGRF